MFLNYIVNTNYALQDRKAILKKRFYIFEKTKLVLNYISGHFCNLVSITTFKTNLEFFNRLFINKFSFIGFAPEISKIIEQKNVVDF